MFLTTLIQNAIMMLKQFWSKIPPEIKDKIIEEILKQLERILREFFKKFKEQQSSK